jgi:hypothetical protein
MAFKKGDRVQTKVRSKTAVPRQGVIVRAVEGDKKHTWEVQFDDKATGQLEIKTCKMMMHPPAATTRNDALQASVTVPANTLEEVYTLIRTSGNPSSCTGTALNEAAVSEVVIENELVGEEEEQVENEEPPPASTDNNTAPEDTDSVGNASIDSTYHFSSEANCSMIATSIATMFPDFEIHAEVEDIGYIPNESCDSVEAEAIEIEPEDVYQTKQRIYIEEKAALLARGCSYEKKPSDEGINIGSLVHTKSRKDRKFGRIVGRSENDKDWMVLWQHENEPVPHNFKFLQRSISPEANTPYVWKMIQDVIPTGSLTAQEYGDIGVTDFRFGLFNPESTSKDNPNYDEPYLQLLQKLWHGDWMQQLEQCNSRIRILNAANNEKRRPNKKIYNIPQLSPHEWWVFHGILISGCVYGKGGKSMWQNADKQHDRTMMTSINFGRGEKGLDIMLEYRFNQIKAVYPYSFNDREAQVNGDPWHMIMLGLDGLNKNRKKWIAASVMKILDESMSAWCPQSTKTGGLPHLSFILRKPEPLGTEFKCICCTKTGQ